MAEKLREISDLSREELLEFVTDAAKRWLAHDGLWFQAIENKHGMEEAIEMDRLAWEKFTVNEANRIIKQLNLEPNGGLQALKQALKFRLYALINEQEIIEEDENTIVFRMNRCRVQEARKRKGLPDFPCKPVGIVEYTGFAQTIDPRIKTEIVACPPDAHPDEYYCAWRFKI